MKKIDHAIALEKLKQVNNLIPDMSTSKKNGDSVTIQYKAQLIDLENWQLVVTGSAEQWGSYKSKRDGITGEYNLAIYLAISLYDNDSQEIPLTANQQSEFRKVIQKNYKDATV